MKQLYYILLLACFSAQAQYGILPANTRKPSVMVSFDEGRVVAYHLGVLGLWDGNTGALIRHFDMADKEYLNNDTYVYSLTPDGKTVVLCSNNGLYMFDDEGNYMTFPKGSPDIFIGFDYLGRYIGSRVADGKKQIYAFDAATGQEELLLQCKTPDPWVRLTSDGKACIVRDDMQFKSYYMPTKKHHETVKGFDSWSTPHQPEGWIRVPKKNKKGEETKQLFLNYITGEVEDDKPENEFLSTLKGICVPVWYNDYMTVIRTSNNYQWQIASEFYSNNILSMKVKKFDRKNCGKPILEFMIQEDPAAAKQRMEAADEAKYASQVNDFREFEINFQDLPYTYTLDYNTIQGRDITHLTATKRLFPYTNGTVNAIGRINNCNGGGAFLVLLRTQTDIRDTSTFGIITTDKYGNSKGYRIVTQTQKDMGNLSVAGHFTINKNGNSYTVNASKKYTNGHEDKENFTGGCF